MLIRLAVLASALLFCSTSAHAVDYKLEFSATDFKSVANDLLPAPQSTVHGSFIFSAPSLGTGATFIKELNLSIGSHTYSIPEIANTSISWGSGSPFKFILGGIETGINGVQSGTNDFVLIYGDAKQSSIAFLYSTSESNTNWYSQSGTSTYTQVASVPEPDTYALLLGGLGFIRLAARRRKTKA